MDDPKDTFSFAEGLPDVSDVEGISDVGVISHINYKELVDAYSLYSHSDISNIEDAYYTDKPEWENTVRYRMRGWGIGHDRITEVLEVMRQAGVGK